MPNTTYGSPYAQSSDLVSNWPGVSLNVADRLDDVSFKGNGLNDQTGTTYTLVLTDAGKTVTLNNASAVTVTVPTNASVAYETGTCIYFTNKGAGVVTISAAGGVTLNNSSTLAQYATCYIQKLDTNTWVMVSAPAAGLTLITSSTFSAVSTVSITSLSGYDAYNFIMNVTDASANDWLYFKVRDSGGDKSANYAYGNIRVAMSGASPTVSGYSTSNFGSDKHLAGYSNATLGSWLMGDLIDLTNARRTIIRLSNSDLGATGTMYETSGLHNSANAMSGFTVYGTGTITGNIRIYGYRNS